MIVAVASQNFSTVTGHAGKARRFILFDTASGTPQEVDRLDLPMGMAIHDFQGDGAHPLDRAQVIIAGSAGQGFINRMVGRGVAVALTSETDPAEAARRYLANDLPPPAVGEACSCGGGHHHH
jgi:predicted Fe-Mo cluster-binding NifX family protein